MNWLNHELLNHELIEKKTSKRILKTKSFMNKYYWKGINYTSGKQDWTKFAKNNPTIALNALIKWTYFLTIFENTTQILKKAFF